MVAVEIGNTTQPVPTTWKELTRRDLLHLGGLYPLLPTDFHTVAILLHFLQLHRFRNFWQFRKLVRQARALDPPTSAGTHTSPETHPGRLALAMQRTIEQLDNFRWLFEKNTLTTNLFPSFRAAWRIYHGPGDYMYNCEADEWVHADRFYLDYLQNADPLHLSRLIATLWRTSGKGNPGDARQHFHPEHTEAHARFLLRHLPRATQHALLLQYEGLRNSLFELPEAQLVFSESYKGQKDPHATVDQLYLRLAGKEFGPVEAVRRANVYDFIRTMYIHKKDAKEIERTYGT